jgi:hypothetical protein
MADLRDVLLELNGRVIRHDRSIDDDPGPSPARVRVVEPDDRRRLAPADRWSRPDPRRPLRRRAHDRPRRGRDDSRRHSREGSLSLRPRR